MRRPRFPAPGRARSGRRGLSPLGILLVLIGLVVLLGLFVPVVHSLWFVFALWPLVLVVLGLLVLVRRAGWVRELELSAPSVAAAVNWPRRLFAASLILAGLLLLPITLHLVDERVVGAAALIALGVFLIWRRTR